MIDTKPTLDELFNEYQEMFKDLVPVMQMMGISDEELYYLLSRAVLEGKPLEFKEISE